MRCPNHLLLQLEQLRRLKARRGYRGPLRPIPNRCFAFRQSPDGVAVLATGPLCGWGVVLEN
jgi:hypothetical protein